MKVSPPCFDKNPFSSAITKYKKQDATLVADPVDQLTVPAQRLLPRLAWLAPDPIPESLMETRLPDDMMVTDAFEALVELESYSLVTRATNSLSFSVHRLVQEVTRRSHQGRHPKDAAPLSLVEALEWINAAFVGDPMNPHDWPVLDPLLPHARAVAIHADGLGIPEPTARLVNQVGLMLYAKAQYAEAEPMMRRAAPSFL